MKLMGTREFRYPPICFVRCNPWLSLMKSLLNLYLIPISAKATNDGTRHDEVLLTMKSSRPNSREDFFAL
jgi:hypothetical protein